ncbi:Uncharacterized protein APZ42_029944 [Daphnia magna]|uniref:Integrase catalytic domain-containing protein n=1 Tax=Daphnia magna TaxID=35525 RepID=A0A164P6K7_9CRUS|nr:Uncharacterized protein APZ42_029944 [Daphnia magna]
MLQVCHCLLTFNRPPGKGGQQACTEAYFCAETGAKRSTVRRFWTDSSTPKLESPWAEQKWYSYKEATGQLATEWQDAAGPSIELRVRTQVLEQFKLVNQNRFNKTKLRDGKQGIKDFTVEYFYDILDLCRTVDPNITEATKLAHLWRGLMPSLLEKLWILKPNFCDEFPQEIERYQEMTSRRMLVLDVLCWGKKVAVVIDTGAIVSVCSPKLVKELRITVAPWCENRLVSVDGKEIQPGGAAMLSISDGRINVEGEPLMLDSDIDLFLGKYIFEKFETWMKIGVLAEILIGDIGIEALVDEVTPKVRRVETSNPARFVGFALVEPSQALQMIKRVSTRKALISSMGTIGQMAVTNLSDHKQWIEEGAVLGVIEPGTDINEGDTPIVAVTAVAEKKAVREHEFESRIGEGLMPTDREKILETPGRPNRFDNHPMHCMGGEDHYRTSVKRNEECRSYRTLEQSLGSGYGPVTISDVYPLPRIKETQARMEGAAFFSIIQTRRIWSQDTGKFPLGKVIEQKWRLSQRTGYTSLSATIRQHFWITSGREVVKKTRRACVTCHRNPPKHGEQYKADLPESRLDSGSLPFTRSAIDLFGSFDVGLEIEQPSLGEFYLLLSMQKFITMYQKFVVIHSDNGTNFVGAERELCQAVEALDASEGIPESMKDSGIVWTFQPPRISHFGGTHESLVKSTKRALYSTPEQEGSSLRYPSEDLT